MSEYATEKRAMDASTPSSRAVIAWAVVVSIAFLGAGTLIVYQRDRGWRPSREKGVGETSIPQAALEDLARDFRKPARERRFKGQFVEVSGAVVQIADAPDQQGKPALLVYLAPAAGQEALVCCACRRDRVSTGVRVGEEVVVQGTVDVIASEGPQQAGLVNARIVRRVSE